MASSHRYWLALHPDIHKPIGGVKQMHRFAEAISACGRQATLIQDDAYFHPGWFQSRVSTISFSAWKQRQDLNPQTDVVVMPDISACNTALWARITDADFHSKWIL